MTNASFSVQPSRVHRIPVRTVRARTRAVVWTTVHNPWVTGVCASDHGSDPPAPTQVPLLISTGVKFNPGVAREWGKRLVKFAHVGRLNMVQVRMLHLR